MIIRSRKRSNVVVSSPADRVKADIKKAEERKARTKKVVKKEEESVLPLVEEALASIEE